MIQLRDDILNKKKLFEEKELINKIINIIQTKEEYNFKHKNTNLLDILKQNLNKINENNDDNHKDIKNEENKFINESIIYPSIDYLITNYFEPFYNEIIDSKLKINFMNKIMDFIMQNLNKEDNKFFDFISDIKDLIITK